MEPAPDDKGPIARRSDFKALTWMTLILVAGLSVLVIITGSTTLAIILVVVCYAMIIASFAAKHSWR